MSISLYLVTVWIVMLYSMINLVNIINNHHNRHNHYYQVIYEIDSMLILGNYICL